MPGLDVRLGLALAGFEDDLGGRAAFGVFVSESLTERDGGALEGGDLKGFRARARQRVEAAVDIGYPTVSDERLRVPVSMAHWARPASIDEIIEVAADAMKVPVESVLGRSRARRVTAVRRIIVCISEKFGYSFAEVGRRLGISAEAAGHLFRRARPRADDSVLSRIERHWQRPSPAVEYLDFLASED